MIDDVVKNTQITTNNKEEGLLVPRVVKTIKKTAVSHISPIDKFRER